MMSDSEYEEVGLSDCQVDEKSEEESTESVHVAPLAQRVQVVALPEQLELLQRSSSEAGEVSSMGSTTSSFVAVQKLGALNLSTNTDSDTESYAFQSAASSSSLAGDEWSAAPSSTTTVISGFDYLSLGGKSLRRCKRCSFLNPTAEDQHGISLCLGCGAALSANPCLDMDAQIAMNLQLKEEKDALTELRQEEKKRKTLSEQSLFVQAQVLVNDVVSFVDSVCHDKESSGISTLPVVDFTLQASNFIDCVRRLDGRVSLAYTFSSKDKLDDIRKSGFGSNVQVCNIIDAAFKWTGTSASGLSTVGSLFSIPENMDSDSDMFAAADRLGWIVAQVFGVDQWSKELSCSTKRVKAKSGFAEIRTLESSTQCLPLVCFDSSLGRNDIIRRLLNGLSTVCIDFFHTDWSSSLEQQQVLLASCHAAAPAAAAAADHPTKKPRILSSPTSTRNDQQPDSVADCKPRAVDGDSTDSCLQYSSEKVAGTSAQDMIDAVGKCNEADQSIASLLSRAKADLSSSSHAHRHGDPAAWGRSVAEVSDKDVWRCSLCDYLNSSDLDVCPSCTTPRPSDGASAWGMAVVDLNDEGVCRCSLCEVSNSNNLEVCTSCNITPRPSGGTAGANSERPLAAPSSTEATSAGVTAEIFAHDSALDANLLRDSTHLSAESPQSSRSLGLAEAHASAALSYARREVDAAATTWDTPVADLGDTDMWRCSLCDACNSIDEKICFACGALFILAGEPVGVTAATEQPSLTTLSNTAGGSTAVDTGTLTATTATSGEVMASNRIKSAVVSAPDCKTSQVAAVELEQLFKDKNKGTWLCSECLAQNPNDRHVCECCAARLGGPKRKSAVDE